MRVSNAIFSLKGRIKIAGWQIPDPGPAVLGRSKGKDNYARG